MGAVIDFRRPATVDEAWQRYLALVTERAEQNLWADLEHNQRIARAWDRWAKMFLESDAS
jgi:hypothetical protein